MAKGKNVLTTGDVARICNVAPRTVSKWFDSGQLKGYRIPGSKDRRIPLNELLRFMKENNMPSPSIPTGKIRVLIVDSSESSSREMAQALNNRNNYETQTVSSNFETGLTAQKFNPHVMLINLFADGIDAGEICKSIRLDEELRSIKIIAVANQLSTSEAAALLQKGFDGYVSNPTDINNIIEEIEHATAIVY